MDTGVLNISDGNNPVPADTQYIGALIQRDASIASGTYAVTGVGFKPKAVLTYVADVSGGFDAFHIGMTIYEGNVLDKAQGLHNKRAGVLHDYIQTDQFALWQESASNTVTSFIQSFDADGFTVSFTKNGTPTQVFAVRFVAFR